LACALAFVPRCIGKALSFASAFEYLFARQFEDDHWSATRTCLEEQRDAFAARGNLDSADEIQGLLDELPGQQAMWLGVQADWLVLKRDHLSSDVMERWSQEQLAPRITQARAADGGR
jgi:hypothetical protein